MTANKITQLKAREIIDCRGWPTVQVDVYVDDVLAGRADVSYLRALRVEVLL
jgi:enolase